MSDPAQLLVDHLDIWTGAIERKSGAGRGNGGKISLYGIDKLRSLILDLAVLGKLVPQDPADGDAGELLRRARQAINQAVARKQMRAPKAPKFEPPEAELPQGWVWARLIDVAQINPRNEADDDSEASFVPMPLVSDRVDGAHETETRRWGDIRSGYTHFADGDIALAKITPCFENGKAAVFAGLENGIGAGTTELHVARPMLPELDRRFLLLTLKTPRYLAEGEAGMTGTAGQKRVPRGYFELTPFPLPPLAEQKRIVGKVDELMALVDALEAGTRAGIAAHETLVRELLATLVNSQDADDLAQNWSRIEAHFDTLFTTEDSIDTLKETIVDLGVRGKLCIQDHTEDNANQTKLRADRDAENYDLDAFEKRAQLFGLPQGWTIEPLSRVSSNIVDCPHTTPKWTDDGEICVKSEQIFAGFLDLSRPNFVSEDTYIERIERLEPKADDILYKREGGILGIGARIPHGKRVCLGQRLMLIRANEAVLPAFLELAINSPWLRDFAREKTTGGAAPRVNMSIVRAYPVPIPPIREQERILRRVDELFQLCEQASKSIADMAGLQIKLSDALTVSVA